LIHDGLLPFSSDDLSPDHPLQIILSRSSQQISPDVFFSVLRK